MKFFLGAAWKLPGQRENGNSEGVSERVGFGSHYARGSLGERKKDGGRSPAAMRRRKWLS